MPTITTTITSAEATGAVTTVTTTEATPEVVQAAEAAFALPKITDGQAMGLFLFQFANKADTDAFTTMNFSGTQGASNAAGVVEHVWETTTPNQICVLVNATIATWHPQQDFWKSHPTLVGVIGKATWWEGHVFGDLGNGFKEGMDMWGQLPNGKMHYCNDTLNAYNLNPIKPHSMILLGIMEGKPASFDASMPDFLSFAKCYTSSFAMGDIGGGITICFQVYDSGADFVRGCDAFTPWFQSGANPALIEFFTTAPITSYAVGGLSPAAKKALAPYGDLPNFDQVYPKLIGAHGGDGAGGSHVVHYFRNAADAAAGKRAYNKVFQQARDGGANIGGTCTDYRQCTSAISIIVNYDTVPDWAAAHEKAYADEDFQKVAASWIHAQVEIYGSMTYELASTFPGWESLGSVCFRKDTPILYTSIHGVEQSDDPVEIMQHIDLCGDGKAYLDFFLDPRIAKLTYEHKATFVITQYGPEKAKGYFRFKNSQSFADYWTAAGVEAGDKLTAIVEAGKAIECTYWGNYNPAAQAVVALYESMPQFTMFKIHADKI